MLPTRLIRYRRPIIFSLHLALVPVGYWLAFALRFPEPIPERYFHLFWSTLPYVVAIRLFAFAPFGLYHGWWRHVGMQDLVDLVKAVTLSSGLILSVFFFQGHLRELPRSILVLDWGIALLLFGGMRFLVRSIREGRMSWNGVIRGTPALVIGAGDAADRLLRQLPPNRGREIHPVGLVDDDPNKRGLRIHGVKVLGSTAELTELVQRTGARLLVIAIPSATREQMQRLVERCIESGVEYKIVPSLLELLDGRARLSQLRSVRIEDLLGRTPIELDLSRVEQDIAGRSVLVTGGAGSIGSELARQIAAFGPARLILLEQAESPLYYVHLELCRQYPVLEVVPVIADVADLGRLERIFARHRPDYVFHAAAYKHVPLMEANVVEAVRNNVLGTFNVAQCAAEYGAEKFVLISTDKAVKPSSVMGATKRVAERLVLGWPAFRSSATDFRAVRFGNVLGSEGSVIPLFERQLAAGGPLTVTDPDVTRYFMTIPEAVQLVLQAAALPRAAGRIAMLDMGEPVRIVDLAENLLRLSGLEPYRDVPIVFTGLRPGEKLNEELMSDVELTVPTEVPKVRLVQTDEADGALIEKGMDRLATEVALGDRDGLLRALGILVPECVSPLRERWLQAETIGAGQRGVRS